MTGSEGSAGALQSGALFPPGVAVAVLGERDATPRLLDAEVELVARAVERRRDEFARGRACARSALAQLGVAPSAILVDPSRAPMWPAGIVGSITHCERLAAAAACWRGRILGLGLDAETFEPLEPEIAEMICTARERRATPAALGLDEALAAKLIFSAKEAVHKCIQPLTGVALDFPEVEIALNPGSRDFAVRPVAARAEALPQLRRISGRWHVSPTHILTAACVLREPQR
jgi:4'-phosphopantetheinyl transferase EntD